MSIKFPRTALDCADIFKKRAAAAIWLPLNATEEEKKQQKERMKNLVRDSRRDCFAKWSSLLREYAKQKGWHIVRFKKEERLPILDGFSLYKFNRGIPVQVPLFFATIESGYYAVKQDGSMHRVIPNIKDMT